MRQKSDNTHSMIDFAEMLIQNELSLSIKMKGMSMYPAFKEGDVGEVVKCSSDKLKVGDIVVWRSNQLLVAHRLIQISGEEDNRIFLTIGDNNHFTDRRFTEKELIGKLASYQRNNEKKSISSLKMNILRFASLHCHSLLVYSSRIRLRMKNILPYTLRQFRSVRSNIRSLLPGSERLFRAGVILAVLKGLVPLAMIVSIKFLIDFITRVNVQATRDQTILFALLGMTAFLFLAGGVLNQLSDYFTEKMSQSVTRKVYDELHQKHIRLQLSEFEDSEKLDKMHRAVQEASYRPVRILQSTLGFIKTISAGVFLLALFIWVRWYLVFILLAAVVPEAVVRLIHSRKLYRMRDAQVAAEREKYYYNRVLTGYPFAKELRLFGFARYFLTLFNRKQDELFADKLKLSREETRRTILAQTFGVLLIFTALGIVSYLTVSGWMTVGTVVLFFFAFQRGYGILNEFFRSVTGLVEDNTYLNDLLGFLNAGKDIRRGSPDLKPFSLQQGIRFENVDFRYENSQRNALSRVNLHIPAGKTVALVGENGSGKTTLVKLLCGFYQPASGRILIDETDAGMIGQDQMLANITAVFQDFALYQVSALDNILLGDITSSAHPEKAKEAAHAAEVDEVLAGLPNGYNTRLGHLFRESEELSIGQWQKVALARAFYRNAPLLLMDEPSSALDANSEQVIIDNLKLLAEGKTTLIVSHRLSTVQWADYIYLLERGLVSEAGTHEELMKREGKYFSMFNRSRG